LNDPYDTLKGLIDILVRDIDKWECILDKFKPPLIKLAGSIGDKSRLVWLPAIAAKLNFTKLLEDYVNTKPPKFYICLFMPAEEEAPGPSYSPAALAAPAAPAPDEPTLRTMSKTRGKRGRPKGRKVKPEPDNTANIKVLY
jgi:hypothetical protein